MLNLARSLSLLLILALVGCTDSMEPLPVESSHERTTEDAFFGKSSNCETVSFSTTLMPVDETPPFLIFGGTVTGDLEGSVVVTFDTINPFTGATNSSGGTAEWDINSGALGNVGTFETAHDNRNLFVDTPRSPANVVENLGRHLATNGVSKANLTYRGVTTVGTMFVTELDYRGVICP